jgi:hypothetical protein
MPCTDVYGLAGEGAGRCLEKGGRQWWLSVCEPVNFVSGGYRLMFWWCLEEEVGEIPVGVVRVPWILRQHVQYQAVVRRTAVDVRVAQQPGPKRPQGLDDLLNYLIGGKWVEPVLQIGLRQHQVNAHPRSPDGDAVQSGPLGNGGPEATGSLRRGRACNQGRQKRAHVGGQIAVQSWDATGAGARRTATKAQQHAIRRVLSLGQSGSSQNAEQDGEQCSEKET